jgi:hypothetical protein
MATIQEIKELALNAARGTAPENYSVENVNDALRDELNAMCSSINEFRRNQYDIFEIIIETADDIVPKKVIDYVGIFAEVKTVGNGQKAMFKRKLGKNRAKKFLTQVGLSGVYETFRLDTETFTVEAHAVGGAGTIDFDRMLDGSENMSDIMDIITEGLTDSVFYEIQKALIAAYEAAGVPAANRKEGNNFVAKDMQDLVNVVRSYGTSAVIFACPEFVAAMGPDQIGDPSYKAVYSPKDIEDIANTGYIKMFRGTPIIQMPQSFIDENNDKTAMNPQYAFVLPAGGEKVVKVVLEGPTQMWMRDNRDQSMEINAYKKMGAAILTYHNWGVYKNKSISDTSASLYGF